ILSFVQRERISVRYSGTGLPLGADCAKIGRAFCQKAESGLAFRGVSPCACALFITFGVCACAENANQRHANRKNFMSGPPEKEWVPMPPSLPNYGGTLGPRSNSASYCVFNA